MSNVTKIIIAVVGVFAIGFLVVGTSEKSDQQMQAEAFVSDYASLTKHAHMRCKAAAKKYTGVDFLPSPEVETDKSSYMVLKWKDGKEAFDTAECTFTRSKGGMTKFVLNGKTVYSK
jgi:hypothetical protein